MSDEVARLRADVDRLYHALHLVMWDYHNRFHRDAGDTNDYLACVHYPCVNLSVDVFSKQE